MMCHGDPDKLPYSLSWTLRTLTICDMRRANIPALVRDQTPVTLFAKSFPDQHSMFKAITTTPTPCGSFFTLAEYLGPPELFSMYACLFQDAAVEDVSTEWMSTHTNELTALRKEYRAEHGQNPVPAVLLQTFNSTMGRALKRRRLTV